MAIKYKFFYVYFLIIPLIFIQCSSGKKVEGVPHYVKKPVENPLYLTGRLPGKEWKEHDPARFSSNQSFEASYGWEKALLFVKLENNQQSAKAYSDYVYENMKKNVSLDYYNVETFETAEGIWLKSIFASKNGFYDLYVTRKKDYLVSVHYIATSDDTYHHFSKDAANYIKNFWFLYDNM